jgi:recombinational DNA repair ATPase RecF
MLERLELRNFTAFASPSMDFSPTINVLIGKNDTGKTHLLKAAYGLCFGAFQPEKKSWADEDESEAALTAKLLRLFLPLDGKIGRLRRPGATGEAYMSALFFGGDER